jgi:hypothetical protein
MLSNSTIILICLVISFAALLCIVIIWIWDFLFPSKNIYSQNSEKHIQYIEFEKEQEEALKRKRELAAQKKVLSPFKNKNTTYSDKNKLKKSIKESYSSNDSERRNSETVSEGFIYTLPTEDYSPAYSNHSPPDFGGGHFDGGGTAGDYSTPSHSSSCSSSSCSSSSCSSGSSCGSGGD